MKIDQENVRPMNSGGYRTRWYWLHSRSFESVSRLSGDKAVNFTIYERHFSRNGICASSFAYPVVAESGKVKPRMPSELKCGKFDSKKRDPASDRGEQRFDKD